MVYMKKKRLKGISAILVCCILATSIFSYSSNVKANSFDEVAMSTTPPEGMSVHGSSTSLTFQTQDKEVRVCHPQGSFTGYRVQMNPRYFPLDNDITFAMEEIDMGSKDYSVAIALGNSKGQWYSQAGYMLIYCKDGNFAIGKTETDSTGKGAVKFVTNGFQTHELEPFTDTVSIQISLAEDKESYSVIINGQLITLLKGEKWQMDNPETLTLGFGIMPGFEITGDTSIQFLNSSYIALENDVSYVIDMDYCSPKLHSTRNLRPLAKYVAFMDHIENFKANLTRRDAIVAMAKLLIEPEAVCGVYTTDFEDVASSDSDYDIIAYMDRNGYLPEFGSKLEPNRAITISEFLDLMLADEDVWNGEGSELVSQDSITSEEAAKYFCEYIGKEDDGRGYVAMATTDTSQQIDISVETADELRQAIMDAAQYPGNTRAIITLAEGDYCFTESMVIDNSTCGEIVIRGAENAQSVVTGNQDIRATEFQAVAGKNYWVYEFEKQGETYPQFRDVYLNGERLQLAKSARLTFTEENQDESGNMINQFGYDSSVYDASVSQELPEVCMNIGWRSKRFHVASFDAVNGYFTIDESEWSDCVKYDTNKWTLLNESYWFENSLSLLDEPGEFFYDEEQGKLYVYPYSSIDMTEGEHQISYSTVERLFDLQDVSGITFERIRFTGVTSNYVSENGINTGQNNTDLNGGGHIKAAAIYGSDTAHVNIRNCDFDELGANGVCFNEGNHNLVMKGNSFTDIAMSAAILGEQVGPWNYTNGISNIVFDNNYVNNIGTDYLSAPAVSIPFVKNIAVTHNTIVHTPYTGISFGWITQPGFGISVQNAEVSYNRLEDNLYALNDGAALYFAGASGLTSDTTIYNYVHDNYIKGTGYTKTYSGIYLDMNASNYQIYRNVIDGIMTSTLHGPVYCQYINNSYDATTQQTYNIIIQENYTTVKPITVSNVLKDNNIQLLKNKNYAVASVLPAAAQTIMTQAGQDTAYKEYRSQNDTEIIMTVPESHININHGVEAAEPHVEFCITNHGDSTATYSVAESTVGKYTVLSNTLRLEPGATGTIECRFVCTGTFTNNEIYLLAKYESLATLTIIREDGWKQEYRRVLAIKAGLPTQLSQYNSAVTSESIEHGVKVCMSGNNTNQATGNDYITVRNSYYMRDAGIDIEVSDITANDQDYSIAIMLSNATSGASSSGDLFSGWHHQSGYMFIFGKSGQFTILETDDDENTTLDDATVIVSDQLEQLNDSLSMHIRLEGEHYRVAVGDKNYVIPAKDKQYPLTDIENLFVAFGVLGDKTDSMDTYEKEMASGDYVSFVISQLGLSRRGEFTIGGGDTNEVSLYLETGATLPTGYYYEHEENQDGKYIVNWTDQDGKVVTKYTSGEQGSYTANAIDLDMLHLYYQKNLYIDNVYRFVGSVDNEEEYEEKGFLFSLDDSCKEPTKEDSETNKNVHFKSIDGYYTGIQAQVQNGGVIETFKVGRDMYDLNSKLLFVRAYKLPSADEKNPIYIRAWVKLKDSDTIIYGPVATFERESDYYNPDIKDDDFTVID